ncbi:MAG: hypothetical protein KF878_35670 [Planctomycetes bacterium]|nr:hypothetical protein [Planctomycetota bacterium]
MELTRETGPGAALSLGLVAGAVLLAAEIVAALLAGLSPRLPLRVAASLVMGSAAIEGPPAFGVMVLGTLLHLALAALYGWIYGAIHRVASPAAQRSFGLQALGGATFGLALWVVNVQIVARGLYPWVLERDPWVQALLHVAAFGVPLGLLFAGAASRPLSGRPVSQRPAGQRRVDTLRRP